MNRRSFLKLLPVGVVAGPAVVKAVATAVPAHQPIVSSAAQSSPLPNFAAFDDALKAYAEMRAKELSKFGSGLLS